MMRAEEGITLVEILVALVIFAVVAVGTLGAVGVTNVGGLLEGFPVAFAVNRTAKDVTAATTYLQTLHEYIETQRSVIAGVAPVTYCAPVSACAAGETTLPLGYPTPSTEGLDPPYQLHWTKLVAVIERWGWNCDDPGQYVSVPPAGCVSDYLIRVKSTLTWTLKNEPRTVTVERFLRP